MVDTNKSNRRWSIIGLLWLCYFVILAIATVVLLVMPQLWAPYCEPVPGYVIGFFTWAGSLGIWLAWYAGHRRSLLVEEISRGMHLEFRAKISLTESPAFREMRFFRQGSHLHGENLAMGTSDGLTVCILDYQFQLSTGIPGHRASTDYHQTVCIIQNAAPQLPDFKIVVRQSAWFKPLAKLFKGEGYPEVDLTGSEWTSFSKHYQVFGDREMAVRGLLTPAVRKLLEADPGQHVEVERGHLLLCRMKTKRPPKDWPKLLSHASLLLRELCATGG